MNEKIRLFYKIYEQKIFSMGSCYNKINIGNVAGGNGYKVNNSMDFSLLCDGYKTYYDLTYYNKPDLSEMEAWNKYIFGY